MVAERTVQLEHTRAELIKRLSRAMEFHESQAVGNRVMRLGHYAKLLAQAAGVKPEIAEMMLKAAPLHDVGKLGVPAEILRKKEKLSAPDWERVKRHPALGAEIIGEHDDPLLKLARQIALTHHECWDGSGYPQGLKGEAIPWPGRIMAVVDAFESMTTTQFYRSPKSVEDAMFEIEKFAGRRYDPKVVEAFKKALPAMQKVRESFADALGNMINLDFAPKGAPAPAKPAAAPLAAATAPKPPPPKKPALDAAALAAERRAKEEEAAAHARARAEAQAQAAAAMRERAASEEQARRAVRERVQAEARALQAARENKAAEEELRRAGEEKVAAQAEA